jgi:hypothetical protein
MYTYRHIHTDMYTAYTHIINRRTLLHEISASRPAGREVSLLFCKSRVFNFFRVVISGGSCTIALILRSSV